MKFLETPEEKKSFTITSVIFVILFLLFTIFGLTYMDPPPENGIAVNFGTSETGSGEIQPTEPIQSAPEQAQSKPVPAEEDDVLTIVNALKNQPDGIAGVDSNSLISTDIGINGQDMMFLADNGSNWYISGAPDSRWDDDELGELKSIAGSNFEGKDLICG